MTSRNLKTIIVPEEIYQEVKHFADQVCATHDIHAVCRQYHIDPVTKKTLMKQLCVDVSQNRDTPHVVEKSLILSLLFFKYGLSRHQAFTIVEDMLSSL
jgi:hypothetical protein